MSFPISAHAGWWYEAGADAQRLMSRVAMIFGLASAIAPIVGGLLLGPWHLVFWFMGVHQHRRHDQHKAQVITPYVGGSALGFALTALVLVMLGVLCWVAHRRALARGTLPTG